MKTMMSVDGEKIIRVNDEKASRLFEEGFRYVSKSMWKEKVRDVNKPSEEEKAKDKKKSNKMSKAQKRHAKKSD